MSSSGLLFDELLYTHNTSRYNKYCRKVDINANFLFQFDPISQNIHINLTVNWRWFMNIEGKTSWRDFVLILKEIIILTITRNIIRILEKVYKSLRADNALGILVILLSLFHLQNGKKKQILSIQIQLRRDWKAHKSNVQF